jgi:hypothetical protein
MSTSIPLRYPKNTERHRLGPKLILHPDAGSILRHGSGHDGPRAEPSEFIGRKTEGHHVPYRSDDELLTCQFAEIMAPIKTFRAQDSLIEILAPDRSLYVAPYLEASTIGGAQAWISAGCDVPMLHHTPADLAVIDNAFREAGQVYLDLGNHRHLARIRPNVRIIYGCRGIEVEPAQRDAIIPHVRDGYATVGTCAMRLRGCATPRSLVYALMAQGHIALDIRRTLTANTPVSIPSDQVLMEYAL